MSGRWELGDVFVLRHAGFPFDWLEELGLSARVLDLARAVAAAQDDVARAAGDERVRAELARGRVPGRPRRAGGDWDRATARWAAAHAALLGAYADALPSLRARLHELARDPAVREAVFLSNPAMYDNVWSGYAGAGGVPDNARWRRVERQVYTYLQRFCAKNETTSFFGPMGYGEVVDGDAIEVRRRPTRRRTFLSYWAVTELARAVNRDRRLRADLPVRVEPSFRVSGGRARSALLDADVALDGPAAALVERVTRRPGESCAAAARALGRPVREVLATAVPLARAGVLSFGVRVRADDFAVFESLRAAIDDLEPSPARDEWRAVCARLEDLRTAFERGGLDERRALLAELEDEFARATGAPARRGAGEIYADRLVVYEEAASPFELRVGRAVARRLVARLEPALELSAGYGGDVQRAYARAAASAAGGDGTLTFVEYARRTRPRDEPRSRFSPVPPLRVDADGGRVARVAPTGDGGRGGRYALLDVCVAAPSADAARADATVVLARVHHHLLLWSWLCAFFPDRARLEASARAWLEREPSARGLVGLEVSRRNKGFYCWPGPAVALPGAPAAERRDGVALEDLAVEVGGDGPALVDARGRRLRLYLPLADLTTYPPLAALAHPLVLHAPFAADRHTPRVVVGDAVYQRERWTAELGDAGALRGPDLLVAVLRARDREGWPRFVFARVAGERKPYLVDTESPFALEMLRHLARDRAPVTVEEMLPGPAELWLRDDDGRRYTCELRMQAHRWSE